MASFPRGNGVKNNEATCLSYSFAGHHPIQGNPNTYCGLRQTTFLGGYAIGARSRNNAFGLEMFFSATKEWEKCPG